MRVRQVLVALWVLGIGSSLCLGASATYLLQMDGGQEVPGPGDPDGVAVGTITADDVTGLISWDLTHRKIDPPTAMHIHGPNGSAGQSAGVHIGLGVATGGGPGTLIASLTHGTLQDLTDILNDPTDFYVNIHNGPFSSGAVRGQLGHIGAAIYPLEMDGDQEVPGPGDPDGTASGTLSADDRTGEIAWNLTYQNIATPTAMHIHGPNGSTGESAGVYIGLGVATSGGPDSLSDSLVHPNPQDLTDILADPTDFYVNIHNGAFSAGAVRGQLGASGIPGQVPCGESFYELPLLLGKAAGGTVDADWVPSCQRTDTDYAIYRGDIGAYYSHEIFICSTGGLTFANFAPGVGSHYYLVVPNDTVVEGSYGVDSTGVPRLPPVSTCFAPSTGGPMCP